jgi:hypothetical protein
MKGLLIFSILAVATILSQSSIVQAQDKIQSVEVQWLKDLDKNVSEKQQKSIALITLLANQTNERYGMQDESKKEEAEYAHASFVARFQGIREDRDALARKEIQPDYATLQNYSKRLDSLIKDLQEFLKQ